MNLYFPSTVIDFSKLGLNIRNAKGLNIFKNKACVRYYHQKMVDTSASTAAGSSNDFV